MTDPSTSRQEVDAKIAASAAETHAEFAALRADIAEHRTEVKTEIAEMRVELADMRTEMRTGFAEIRTEMANGNGNLVKWFVGTSVSMAGVVLAVMSFMLNANKPMAPPAQQPPIVINVPGAPSLGPSAWDKAPGAPQPPGSPQR